MEPTLYYLLSLYNRPGNKPVKVHVGQRVDMTLAGGPCAFDILGDTDAYTLRISTPCCDKVVWQMVKAWAIANNLRAIALTLLRDFDSLVPA